MFGVELICSDERCAETVEAIGDLAELGVLVCECGCTLEITAVWEVREERISVVAEPPFELPLAA